MSRHLGLIIGVNQYQDNTFQPLRFAENDARALAQWLVNTKGGKWSPPDVQLVQGQYATRELVESLITQICIQKAEPGDVVLLYFAGHALVDEQTGEGYLALVNSQYQTASTSISLLSFTQQIMARSRATHILCIVDCFQNGQLWGSRRTSPFDSKPLLSSAALTTLQQLPNRLFLCSCRGNEFAPESGERSLGFTAHSMIVGLCGPASDPSTGNILFSGLYTYLFDKLSEQQKPQLFGQQQFPLTLVGELPVPTITRTLVGSSSAQWATPPIAPNTPNTPNTPSIPKPRVASGLLTKSTTFSEDMITPSPSSPLQSQASYSSGQVLTSTINEQGRQQNQYMLEQARQFFQAQNYGEAFNLTEQVLRLNPADTSALTLKGQLLGVANRFPEAMPIIDQLLQIKPNDALGWSMRAAALTNMGHHQDALAAVEHSLELDTRNPETHSLKNGIMANIAQNQSQTNKQSLNKFAPSDTKQSGAVVFMAGLGLHILGLIVGFVGFALLIALRSAPAPVGLSLISIGLAIACVNAARGSFRYGFIHLVLALLLSLISGGILGAAYKVGLTILINQINVHPSSLSPLLLLGGWLACTALLPLLLAIGGLISGLISRARKR